MQTVRGSQSGVVSEGNVRERLEAVQRPLERELAALLAIDDERNLDELWTNAAAGVREYVLRPAKRLRPTLLLAGHAVAGGGASDGALMRFAAGLELLHGFLLIHDDIADRAQVRRGGPALHRVLGDGRLGEDLGVVVGDHLFARSLEAMLGCGLPRASDVTRYYLAVCRHTAVGQYLDLALAQAPLSALNLWQLLKVAHLKTARYGFAAPLVCGAMFAGAGRPVVDTLDRAGRQLGLAFQLRDDLLGLFGDERVSGKSGATDYYEGKRTFPVLAAFVRADEAGREELTRLWSLPPGERDVAGLARARALVSAHGGVAATERVIGRATRSARKAFQSLPAGHARDLLDGLAQKLAHRSA